MNASRYNFIIDNIKKAGERVLELRKDGLHIYTKNNNPRDLVTNVDIEINAFLSQEVRKEFPGEVIYSEEATGEDISKQSFWSIDPIDGTSCFSRGIPHFSVVIAYVEHGVSIVGAIYNPVTRELFSFEKGQGAFLNDIQVKVSDTSELSKAYVFMRGGKRPELWDWGARVYKYLLQNAQFTANYGSSALDLCFVGAGRIEACVYGNLTAIDIAAAIGFIEEAGGMVIGRDGEPVDYLSKKPQSIGAFNNKNIFEAMKVGISF